MKGRYGKTMLVSTLKGSRVKNVLQAGLDRLSTYGILSNMTLDELKVWVEALIKARCLTVSTGEYPLISLSELGDDVMRERKGIELTVPGVNVSRPVHRSTPPTAETTGRKVSLTLDETYALYRSGLSISEISTRRGLKEETIEQHLAECISEGRPFEISRHVDAADFALIKNAIAKHGSERLRPLHDVLPEHITYGMIKFVIAYLERAKSSSATGT